MSEKVGENGDFASKNHGLGGLHIYMNFFQARNHFGRSEPATAQFKLACHKRYREFIKFCCFPEDINIYSGLWPLSVSPRCQWGYTIAGQTPVLQQKKSQHFEEKHNI